MITDDHDHDGSSTSTSWGGLGPQRARLARRRGVDLSLTSLTGGTVRPDPNPGFHIYAGQVGSSDLISEPACLYCACTYRFICMYYHKTTYTIHTWYKHNTYMFVLDTVLDTDRYVSDTYMIVFACICMYFVIYLQFHLCVSSQTYMHNTFVIQMYVFSIYWYVFLFQIHAHTYFHRAVSSRKGLLARRRAVAAHSPRCRCGRLNARAGQDQANNQKNYLDQVRWTWQRQQQATWTLCCALKCLGAFGCQWSTSRRQRNNVDEQNNNSSRSIRLPLLRKWSWIFQSTCTPKSKHRKSTQTSRTLLK